MTTRGDLLLRWLLDLFRRPDPVPPAVNRKDRRTRRSVARRQAAILGHQPEEGAEPTHPPKRK